MTLDPKMVAELAELGIEIIDLASPRELLAKMEHDHIKRIYEKLNEEYLLDRREHGRNREWTK